MLLALSANALAQQRGFFTDSRDGKTYKTVTINNQVWISENLNTDKFRNGDPIPYAQTDEEWEAAAKNKQPAWCYYANDPANAAKYGKLYNWYAINDPRGLAPEGWKIPTDPDWSLLIKSFGGRIYTGKRIKSFNDFWIDSNDESVGNASESIFCALPGGYRNYDGSFSSKGYDGYWWSSWRQQPSSFLGRYKGCHYNRFRQFIFSLPPVSFWGGSPGCYFGIIYRGDDTPERYKYKGEGFSVRCIKE